MGVAVWAPQHEPMNRKPHASTISDYYTIVGGDSDREPLLNAVAVAKCLGIAPRTVCLWAASKTIPAIKIGRQWRFRENELLEWLRNRSARKSDTT